MCFQSALLSSSCLVRAGGCAGHLGTGSWICLKMFFLEAGSYIVPRRNEKKSPGGFVRPECAGSCAKLWQVAEPCQGGSWDGASSKVGPWQGAVWDTAETHSFPGGSTGPLLPLDHLHTHAIGCFILFL